MNRCFTIAVAAMVLGCAWTGAVALAQDLTVSGTVTDEKKAVVSGVSVTLRDPKGTPDKKSTDASGEFKFEGLKPGRYEISFAKQDYNGTSRTLTLTNESRTVDVALGLGRISTTLNVTDSADFNSATRLYVPDLEVPLQISVVSQQTLRDQNINDLLTALENVSGVTSQKQYGSMEWYTIGGFTQQSGNEFLYIDGMASTGNRPNGQLTNIESIEVIKGPAALMLGTSGSGGSNSGSAGGIVNVTRKKPQAQPFQEFFYRTGRWGLQEFGAASTGTVFGMNKLRYRADLGTSHQDGWRDSGGNRFNLSPVLDYIFNDRAHITLQQSYSRDRFTEDGGVPVALYLKPGFPLDRKLNPPEDHDLYRDWQTQVRFEYNLGHNIRLQNQFFTQVKHTQYVDAEGLTYVAATNMVNRTESYLFSNRRPKQDYVTLSGTHHFLFTNHNWGVSYNWQEHYNFQDRAGLTTGANTQSGAIAALDLNAWLQPGFVDPAVVRTTFNRSLVQYTAISYNNFNLQDQIKLTKRLSVNLVGSRAYSKRRSHNDSFDPTTDTFVSRGVETFVKPQSSSNYRAGLSYLVHRDMSVYFNSATNFAPLIATPTNLDPSIDPNDLKSPINRSYVFGSKWQALGGRLKMDIEVGKKIAQNQFVPILSPITGTSVTVQAGQQSSKTVEYDLEGYLGWGVRATAVYGYAACRYDNFSSSATGANSNFTGRRCQYLTRHSGRAYLTKQIRIGNSNRLSVSLGATYRSKTAMTVTTTPTFQGGWVRFDAGVGFEVTKKWSATVNIQNLLNRQRFVVSVINSGGQVYPGAPFAATLTMRYQFNHDSF